MADKCDEAGAGAKSNVGSYYDPRIMQINDIIQQIVAKGGDPSKIAIDVGGGHFMTLTQIRDLLNQNKQASLNAIDAKVSDCNAQIQPFQDIVDFGMALATGGLSAALPSQMTHVDVSQILAGYPLGGPGAFIPAARDQILNNLQIGGTIKDLITNPIPTLTNIFHF